MRSLQAGAIAGGYVDVEYTYVVDNPTPTIYEARGPGRNSAATKDHNEISHALCVMGNFETQYPSEAVLDALANLVAWGNDRGYWPRQITGPHSAVYPTACCGRNLRDKIGEINRRVGGSSSSPKPPPTSGGSQAVDICRTASGRGYWIAASDGGVFSFGDAKFHGSAGGIKLNAPIVGMAATPKGDGYALVGSDGGVFCYGKCTYVGGMGGKKLNAPIVGIELDADGKGYWLVAADGGVFAFGAGYYGNALEYVK